VDLKVNARTAPAAVARLLPLLLRASTSTTSALDDDEDDGSSMDDMEGNREERAPSSAALGRAVVVMSSEGRAVAMAALVKEKCCACHIRIYLGPVISALCLLHNRWWSRPALL